MVTLTPGVDRLSRVVEIDHPATTPLHVLRNDQRRPGALHDRPSARTLPGAGRSPGKPLAGETRAWPQAALPGGGGEP